MNISPVALSALNAGMLVLPSSQPSAPEAPWGPAFGSALATALARPAPPTGQSIAPLTPTQLAMGRGVNLLTAPAQPVATPFQPIAAPLTQTTPAPAPAASTPLTTTDYALIGGAGLVAFFLAMKFL